MDWNAEGECFFVNTVVGHLWHAIPGAHYHAVGATTTTRPFTSSSARRPTTTTGTRPKHSTRFERTGRRLATVPSKGHGPPSGPVVYSYAWQNVPQDRFGGGHAHAGLLIYQGENWPEAYRGSLFTLNLLGRRLNNDTLSGQGSGYVARHAADFFKSSDPWFQGIEVLSGPDGGVYIADWCDQESAMETTASTVPPAGSTRWCMDSPRARPFPMSPALPIWNSWRCSRARTTGLPASRDTCCTNGPSRNA